MNLRLVDGTEKSGRLTSRQQQLLKAYRSQRSYPKNVYSKLERKMGLEPITFCLEGRYSSQLRYSRLVDLKGVEPLTSELQKPRSTN